MQALFKVAIGLCLAAPLAAFATTLPIEGKITRTLASDEESFGSCMAWLTVSPMSEGLDCSADNWVTFSCNGEHHSKSSARRMFDSAQMAFMTDRRVRVVVDDSRKHNTRCLAVRIDVLSQ